MSLLCPVCHRQLEPASPGYLTLNPGAPTHRCPAPGCWTTAWADEGKVTVCTTAQAAWEEVRRRLAA